MSNVIRREFLQLAKVFKPDNAKQTVAGKYVSEKLDGTRCLWDGGVTRGMDTRDVPWASVTNPKTLEAKPKVKPVATGLWSRYGNPIMAPYWFLDKLPNFILDGELWAGRGNFQTCRSICAGDSPDPRFTNIRYAIYSAPSPAALFQPGLIKNANFYCDITEDFLEWYGSEALRQFAYNEKGVKWDIHATATFDEELTYLHQLKDYNPDVVFLHRQIRLPSSEAIARRALTDFTNKVLSKGGEGVIIRDANGKWTPKRVNDLLKFKPTLDDEAVITGFTCGRQTNKGSKHLGRIGALITEYHGRRLELSGLTDPEREFANIADRHYANEHPGKDMPSDAQGKHFKVGQQVTFKFRELSDEGIPKEASYMRKRDVE